MNTISTIKTMSNLCKIFIRKKIKWIPEAQIITNDQYIFQSLNKELYDAVSEESKNGYFYSQSYWDRYDKTLLFTDSYWTDIDGCKRWLESNKRKNIIDKYKNYFIVDTTYNILLEKSPEDIPLL